MKVVARADLNDNALNGNFFGSSQYMEQVILPITEILRLPVRTLQPSATIHMKDDLCHTPEYMATQRRGY